jgi:hypothetical protein
MCCILLFKMLGYLVNISVHKYLPILKSSIRFLFFFDMLTRC